MQRERENRDAEGKLLAGTVCIWAESVMGQVLRVSYQYPWRQGEASIIRVTGCGIKMYETTAGFDAAWEHFVGFELELGMSQQARQCLDLLRTRVSEGVQGGHVEYVRGGCIDPAPQPDVGKFPVAAQRVYGPSGRVVGALDAVRRVDKQTAEVTLVVTDSELAEKLLRGEIGGFHVLPLFTLAGQ